MQDNGDNRDIFDGYPDLIEAAHREAAELAEVREPGLLSQDAVPGYKIISEIGRGGMGVVYKALQLSTRRDVALKVMLAGVFASRHACKRFRREVELAARLQHAGIVRVLESSTLPTGQQYYAMELVSGQPLDQYVRAHQTDTQGVIRLFVRLCDAVHHAHEHDVIHRDLKPANVIIDEQGDPHVLDFGLAKASDLANRDSFIQTISSPGQVLGTLRYLSPEQAEGRSEQVGASTDVYAIGVMLYQVMTGFLPCTDTGNLSEVIRRITLEPPIRPTVLSDRVDNELETIILKALEKAQKDRYASANELRDDLQRYLDGEPIRAKPPSRLYRFRKRWPKNRKRITRTAAAIVLAFAALVGSLAWKDVREREVARGMLFEAENLLFSGRYPTAAEKAMGAFQLRQDLSEALLVWAQARLKVAETLKDEDVRSRIPDTLRSQLQLDPSQWSYRLLLAELLAARDDPKATVMREEAHREIPDTAGAWHLRAFATLDPEEALRCEMEAVDRERDLVNAWAYLANLHLKRGEYDAAADAAQELIRLKVDCAGSCVFQAKVMAKAGRYDEAKKRLTRAAQWSGPNASIYAAQGVVSLCERNYAQAIAHYTDADSLDTEGMPWPQYGRATPLWIVGRLADAEDDYRIVTKMRGHVSYADARLFLVLMEQARIAQEQGNDVEAASFRDEADKVLQDGLKNVIANSQYAHILGCFAGRISPQELLDSTDTDDIEDVCENAYYAGEAYLLLGDLENACRCFRRCVETGLRIDPDSTRFDPVNEYHLAVWRLDSCEAEAPTTTPAE